MTYIVSSGALNSTHSLTLMRSIRWHNIQGGPKSKPLPNDKKIVFNRIKPVNEIEFIRNNKVWIKYDIIPWY